MNPTLPSPGRVQHPSQASAGLGVPAAAQCGAPVILSSTLLQGRAAVLIEHLGQHYRLQATRQGKLILTK